jgi:hypothetical protein
MAKVPGSIGGTSSNGTLSYEYDDVDDLLGYLHDNTANDINASDVRDSVFTLWERIDKVSIIAGSAASASATFINPNPTTIGVGGIPLGSTFPTVQTMQQMFDKLLYPYQAPALSLSANPSQKEYGDALTTTLSWSYTQKSNPITSATVNGSAVTGTSGTKSATGTYSTIGVSTVNTFPMAVTDNQSNTTVTTTTLTWMNKIRWGSVNLTTLSPSNPNLTTNPELAGNVGAFINSATINGLTGQLATSKAKVYNGIDGGGNYLIFAWPSVLPASTTPSFIVNNLPSTAFTRVKTNWAYTNSFGAVTNYEVWVSNTLQNSPLLVEVK